MIIDEYNKLITISPEEFNNGAATLIRITGSVPKGFVKCNIRCESYPNEGYVFYGSAKGEYVAIRKGETTDIKNLRDEMLNEISVCDKTIRECDKTIIAEQTRRSCYYDRKVMLLALLEVLDRDEKEKNEIDLFN